MSANSPTVKDSIIEIAYNWTTGRAIGHFFTEFRDNQKIWGLRCPSCQRVYVPPQDFCDSCFLDMEDWVEMPGTGKLESYSIINGENPNQPVKPPYVIGLIRLDGADTNFIHIIGGVDLDHIQCGMVVKPRWKDKPQGNILDIIHFEPV